MICEQVLEHVVDPWAAAANLRGLCAPGGHVIVSTPFLIKVHELPSYGMHDYWRFTPGACGRCSSAPGWRSTRSRPGAIASAWSATSAAGRRYRALALAAQRARLPGPGLGVRAAPGRRAELSRHRLLSPQPSGRPRPRSPSPTTERAVRRDRGALGAQPPEPRRGRRAPDPALCATRPGALLAGPAVEDADYPRARLRPAPAWLRNPGGNALSSSRPELLRAGMLRHGCLLVRGIVESRTRRPRSRQEIEHGPRRRGPSLGSGGGALGRATTRSSTPARRSISTLAARLGRRWRASGRPTRRS